MEWQPIETAPKPEIGETGFGERLLICVDCGGGTLSSTRIGWWCNQWMLDSRGSTKENGYRVTHWMPLPPPPQPTKEQRK